MSTPETPPESKDEKRDGKNTGSADRINDLRKLPFLSIYTALFLPQTPALLWELAHETPTEDLNGETETNPRRSPELIEGAFSFFIPGIFPRTRGDLCLIIPLLFRVGQAIRCARSTQMKIKCRADIPTTLKLGLANLPTCSMRGDSISLRITPR